MGLMQQPSRLTRKVTLLLYSYHIVIPYILYDTLGLCGLLEHPIALLCFLKCFEPGENHGL